MYWSPRGPTSVLLLPRPRNSTIQQPGPGRLQAISILHATCTRQLCCRTERSWWQRALILVKVLRLAPNSTIRQAGPGRSKVILTPRAMVIQQRCCQMAWCLLRVDLMTTAMLLAPLNCMTPQLRRGRLLETSAPDAPGILLA